MSRAPGSKSAHAVGRLLQEAEAAWGRQDYGKSIALIEQAARRDPLNPTIALNLARAHGLRFDYPAAERSIERAVQISSRRAETLGDAGTLCLEFEQVDMAIRYLVRAGQKNGVSVGALITLADIFIRDGRTDDAAELVARAARIDRADPRVMLEEAALVRLRDESDDAESLLRTLLANPVIDATVRVRALYYLAEILDRTGRFDAAMATLLEVKAIQRARAAPYAAALALMQERGREMERTISADVLARWRAVAGELEPSRRIALLCGHPRSGTTLLEQILDAHSNIVCAEETRMMHDEAYLPLIRDFPEGTSILGALDSVPLSTLRHARDNYLRCTEQFLGQSLDGRLLVDKNPALNLLIPMVVRVFPEAKLLVAVRDPRDVVMSCFLQALPLTPISSAYLSLEDTVKQYASAMGFWLDMAPRLGNDWMYVRYERLVEDLPGVAQAVLRFLGVRYEERVLEYHEHARTKRVKSPSHAEVTQPIYRGAIGRWKRYEKYLDPYLPALERFMEAFGYS